MPEGDTLHKLAVRMRPLVEGARITAVRTRGGVARPAYAGARIASVEAVGKHLVIGLHDGRRLRTHLGMKGSWHRYGPGERWQRSASAASLVIETEAHVLVCFHAAEVELADAGRGLEALDRLGPDLLADTVDLDEVVARARRRPDLPLVDLLLDQSVASGIGNVYKSEVLFLERIHPQTSGAALGDAALRALFERARTLLCANVATPRRVTTSPDPRRPPTGLGRYFVYRRPNRPCPRCRGPIRSARLGAHARTTYWCPRCQPAPAQRAQPGSA